MRDFYREANRTQRGIQGGGGVRGVGAPPPNFCNHLHAGDVSISLAPWKSQILPLKDISKAKKRSQSLKFQLSILRRVHTHLYNNGLYINLYINLYIHYINSSGCILHYKLRSNTIFYCAITIYTPFILFKSNRI